ncbi:MULTISPECIES: anthranilate synthase component I [Corynebacterium]|uniref:anthranilate synthase component I n=1 Tax=Corynebacterium TaxID=1716 RepID=UPI0008482EC0|nr:MULTISPECIES: anthranilate synthase component I [Corynebacterium]MBC6806015.1 anthranilate synthase component I [Corynebacterium sp. LK30]ODQ42639.1 anthranilate synthase component I [Corynebacterium amycolatum]OFL12494.1 anthranilate synthase [Corynebacterium sp. HMSC063F04]
MTRITMTTRERFRELAAHHRVVPVVRKVLADGETALSAYRKLAADRPGTFLLESSDVGQSWSRWSFIGCGSRAALTVDDAGEATWIGNAPSGAPEGGNPLDALRRTLELLHTELPLADDASVPKLTSGLVGYFGHDIVRYIEPQLPDTTDNDLQIPELMQLLVEDLAAFDHHEGVLWLISNAVNWDGSDERIDQAYDTACDRVNAMVERLSEPSDLRPAEVSFPEPVIRRQRAAEDHMDRIERCKDRIRAGDAFQIVLSQRFEMDTQASAFDIYRILRVSNPSPYMFLVNVPTKNFSATAFQIVGSSPESLVAVQGSEVITNPIAGTRPRGATVEQDNALEADLLADEKENSEHLMLVDLGRNDLGRVCRPGSVVVHDFRHIERYSHVMHLVSTVTGELSSDATAVDAFAATFPAGTLSGAPKPSALSIIDKFEDTRRGVYGGTVGYFDFRGNTDQAIAIRTGVKKGDTVYVQAGGGIVSDSDPVAEDEETRNKAAAVLRAVAAAETLVPAERS